MSHSSPESMLETAERLRAQANVKYKEHAYQEAIALYKTAADLQPKAPVYVSNLSAIQLEEGLYQEALESCDKALGLIFGETNTAKREALQVKILARRARLLLLLQVDEPSCAEQARKALDQLKDRPAQQSALDRFDAARSKGNLINQRLAHMPRYRYIIKPELEYYNVGHDDANSIFRAQFNDKEAHDRTKEHPYAKKLDMRIPSKDENKDFDFAALFVGIGDARHLLASFADVALDLQGRKSADMPAPERVKAHFTLVDIHPTTLCRLLIILDTIQELSRMSSSDGSTNPRARDLLVMLHYVYWGTVVPPSATATLDAQVRRLCEKLETAHKEGGLDEAWIYIDKETVTAMIPKMKWWRDSARAAASFKDMIPKRYGYQHSDPSSLDILDEGARAVFERRRKEALDNLTEGFLDWAESDPTARANMEREAKNMKIPLETYARHLAAKEIDAQAEKANAAPDNVLAERKAINILKVLVPPKHAGEPEFAEKAFKTIRSGSVPSKEILESVHQGLVKRWSPNYTLIDEKWLDFSDNGYGHDPFLGVQKLFTDLCLESARPQAKTGHAYIWSEKFFSLAADGFAQLQKLGPQALKLEMVLADGYAWMDGVKLGAVPRKERFPKSYDRIHASNVPDYVGGYLANFTSAVPLLKSHPKAYFTSALILCNVAWEGQFMVELAKSLDSAIWTYASSTANDLPTSYGIEMCSRPHYLGTYNSFRRLETASKRMSRQELAILIYGTLWKTVLPVKGKRDAGDVTIRMPLNAHAFFRLLLRLKEVGYPIHVLADIVESILENRVDAGYPPHGCTPVPLAARQNALTPICTTPIIAEFEVAASVWESKLFPIVSAVLPRPDDIVRYSVILILEPTPFNGGMPITHPTLALVFGLPKDLDRGMLDPRSSMTGRKTCGTSLQVISTFEFEHSSSVATFLLCRSRADQFRREGYEIAIVNTSMWGIQSGKVKCSHLQVVGDVDKWDRSIKLAIPSARRLSANEIYDVMSVLTIR